ncbi:unnamed protein product [Phaedon cochleariae]|uniref:Uncharacterized protein n=1 Tax=Phaedon cochleariae TaxID=80249 RepID=A0A9N9X100_PHACE|nr:unnamed protein product [Phaedon cochleariae]
MNRHTFPAGKSIAHSEIGSVDLPGSSRIVRAQISRGIDAVAIQLMEDQTLQQWIPRYGDRLALKDFGKRHLALKKSSLIEILRKRVMFTNAKIAERGYCDSQPQKKKKRNAATTAASAALAAAAAAASTREEEMRLLFGRRDSSPRSPSRRTSTRSTSKSDSRSVGSGSVSSEGEFATPKELNWKQDDMFWQEDTFGSSSLDLSKPAPERTMREDFLAASADHQELEEEEDFIVQRLKRKRWGSPRLRQEPGRLEVDSKDFRQMVEKLKKNSDQLRTLVNSNPNTQKGIRKTIEDLGYLMKSFVKRCEEWKALSDSSDAHKGAASEYKEKETGGSTREAGTQTSTEEQLGCAMEKKHTRDQGTQTGTIETADLERVATFEAIKGLLDRVWPEDIYTKTTMEWKDLATLIADKDVAIIVDPEDKGDKGLMLTMRQKFPEAQDMLSTLKDSNIEYLMRAKKTPQAEERTRKGQGIPFCCP